MKKSLITLLTLLLCAGYIGYENQQSKTINPIALQDSFQTALISPERRIHILYGDERGGGHFHTANRPCKSEFPEDWDEEKVIKTIELIAANDNIGWRQEQNGYFAGEQKIDGLNIRVILNPQKSGVITAYPINVTRNACPANDNEEN